ncbi:MAG TPA: 4-(cytidine 5'-diphospho)-2-C-methyl-D-erythritol kinase [Acetobacteraceae bacterium]|nr:4-(cytidine 5'-diphospho)-2-C-methyl-D-erythritol kinase [Acetobacteraceae bacterium]
MDSAPHAESARAKVNLYLHVTGRRADGYHLLDSLVVFAEAADTLALDDAAAPLSLAVEGPFAAALEAAADNLVLRAARALSAAASLPARGALRLRKTLPVASGIGGGSADAAATLRLLCRAWGIAGDATDLHGVALALGADVPVCLAGVPARMAGIGEDVSPAPEIPAGGLVLANPGVPVPTQAVFRARTGPFSPAVPLPGLWGSIADLAAFLAGTRNDLEPAAIGLCPEIGCVLAALRAVPGCRFARMSGSGATCFGLFDTDAEARAAAAALRRPGWWTHGGRLQTQRDARA